MTPVRSSYETRRGEIETYFDRTAVDAWKRLTSTGKVSGIRATVRAGRERMRHLLVSWLPADLTGTRVFDAGCGTGLLSRDAAQRGADVLGVDLSPSLVAVAQESNANGLKPGSAAYRAGDMLEAAHGRFDYIVAMDSLIHYRTPDMVAALARLAPRCDRSLLFTFAPRSPALSAMHFAGRLFPRSDRAPAIEPVSETQLRQLIAALPGLAGWRVARTERVVSGFYTSQAVELVRQ